MMMEPITLPMDRALIDRVENLRSTAEYLKCLSEIIAVTAADLRDDIRSMKLKPEIATGVKNWDTIQTLASLLQDQSDIVLGVARDVEMVRYPS